MAVLQGSLISKKIEFLKYVKISLYLIIYILVVVNYLQLFLFFRNNCGYIVSYPKSSVVIFYMELGIFYKN